MRTRLALLTLAAATAFAAPAPQTFDLTAPGQIAAYTAGGAGYDLGTRPAGNAPFYFSAAVPEGNYRVTVVLGDPAAAATTLVRAESRRLMVPATSTAPGEFVTRSFVVNVRTPLLPPPEPKNPTTLNVRLKPREIGSLTWDEKLTLEFNGAAPRVRSIRIEPADVPTVYLLGDSTVTDQRFDPTGSWGQFLPRFFRDDLAVANHAESGETLKSFLSELRLDKMLSQLHRGDWVLMQFGHNDEKENWPLTYAEAHTTYRAYLRTFIAEVRRRGAHPVLVTPPERRTFTPEGRIRNTHGDYPAAVREVAAEEKIPCLDLTVASTAFYEAMGPQRSPVAFNEHGADATHHSSYGAYVLAACVAEAIRTNVPELAPHLAADFTGFDPHHPPAVEDVVLPDSPPWPKP